MSNVDWEGLKAKYDNRFEGAMGHVDLGYTLIEYLPHIFSEHERDQAEIAQLKRDSEMRRALLEHCLAKDERDQRVILAAEKQIKLFSTHPCLLEDGGFDHDWKFVDDSFDHEFGTERDFYYKCKHCNATKDPDEADDE